MLSLKLRPRKPERPRNVRYVKIELALKLRTDVKISSLSWLQESIEQQLYDGEELISCNIEDVTTEVVAWIQTPIP